MSYKKMYNSFPFENYLDDEFQEDFNEGLESEEEGEDEEDEFGDDNDEFSEE